MLSSNSSCSSGKSKMNIFGYVYYVWKLGYYFGTTILGNVVSRPQSFCGSMVLNATKQPTYNSLLKNSIVLNVMNSSLDSNVVSFGNMSLPILPNSLHLITQNRDVVSTIPQTDQLATMRRRWLQIKVIPTITKEFHLEC